MFSILGLFNHGILSIMYLWMALCAISLVVATIIEVRGFYKKQVYFHKYLKKKESILAEIEAYEKGKLADSHVIGEFKVAKKYKDKYAS